MAWRAVSHPWKPTPGRPFEDGSGNDASIHRHETWRTGNSQTWDAEQYICFSAHVLQRQPESPPQQSQERPPLRP